MAQLRDPKSGRPLVWCPHCEDHVVDKNHFEQCEERRKIGEYLASINR